MGKEGGERLSPEQFKQARDDLDRNDREIAELQRKAKGTDLIMEKLLQDIITASDEVGVKNVAVAMKGAYCLSACTVPCAFPGVVGTSLR